MKPRNTNPRVAIRSRALTTAVLLSCAAIFMLPCLAQVSPGKGQQNPGILPPQSAPHGQTYGEWAAKWWQWAFSIPADRNPLTDTTGEFAGEGQSGSVWFVAGTFGDSVERSYTVPAGKTLFMPVYNWIFGASVWDCEPTMPGVPCDVPTLQANAAEQTETAAILDVFIDGVVVQNVWAYRAMSPGPFPIVYPENSVLGVDAGVYCPNVTDGYWLMIAPLPTGQHVISAYVYAPDTMFGPIEFTVVCHITVD